MSNGASGQPSAALDPITFEVLRSAFTAICNEMALVVAKTAYSTPVNEGHDFAGGLYDAGGSSSPRESLISPPSWGSPCSLCRRWCAPLGWRTWSPATST